MTRSLLPLLILLSLVAPASAAADAITTVDVLSGTLTVRESGEQAGSAVDTRLAFAQTSLNSDVTVTAGSPEPLVARSGCSQTSATVVTCPGVQKLDITTGNGVDSVDLSAVLNDKLVATVDGGAGPDAITGGPSDDVINGDGRNGNGSSPVPADNTGNDLLIGGPGSDTLTGGVGRDALVGFRLNNTGDAGERNVLIGGDGTDLFDLGTSLGPDEVRAGEASEGEETSQPYAADLGITVLFVGDLVTYGTRSFAASGTEGVQADLDTAADDGATDEGDLIGSEVENLVGSARADRLTGDGSANRLEGRLGRDKLIAGAGNDVLNLRDSIEDECPSAGTGSNTINADLVDEATFDECTVNEVSSTLTPTILRKNLSTVRFIPFDDPTFPAEVAGRLKGTNGKLRVALRCPTSPQARCAGSILIEPLNDAGDLADKRYSIKKGARATITLKVGKTALARLKRVGGAAIILTEKGPSPKGPKRVIATGTF